MQSPVAEDQAISSVCHRVIATTTAVEEPLLPLVDPALAKPVAAGEVEGEGQWRGRRGGGKRRQGMRGAGAAKRATLPRWSVADRCW